MAELEPDVEQVPGMALKTWFKMSAQIEYFTFYFLLRTGHAFPDPSHLILQS